MTNLRLPPSLAIAGSLAVGASLFSPTALACGGFFCSRSAPVFQAAERIIFAQEGEQVTQIVEVMYEGPSEKFSWILPVPGIPEPGVSSKEVFDRLDASTAPQYRLEQASNHCSLYNRADSDGQDNFEATGGTPPPVTVLDAGSVGPFDYETISITATDDPASVAVAWLEDNGYDVTEQTGEVLGPYLANGLNLIAFRLQKGQSTGAIRPISLEYEAPRMAIPIRPTQVAANDDMPVLVWLLGKDRAVPTNYRGLEINELLIDWFQPASSYQAVVTAAANEAGGQGFVTELVGDPSQHIDSIVPSESDISRVFDDGTDLETTLGSIIRQLGTWDGFIEGASPHIQLRAGVTMEEFISCSYCYFHPEEYTAEEAEQFGFGGAQNAEEGLQDDDPIFDTSLNALEASLRQTVIQPLIEAGELLEKHNKITRLYTTMSADEMTVDPVFEFNPDLGDVSNVHTALQEMQDKDACSGDSEAKWTITLEDGTKVYGQGRVWPHSLGKTELAANARILQFSTSGLPQVVNNMMPTNITEHQESPAGTPPESTPGEETQPLSGDDSSTQEGGGCSTSPRPARAPFAPLAGLTLLAALFARRRWSLNLRNQSQK